MTERFRSGAQAEQRSPTMMGCKPRATNKATTARSWRFRSVMLLRSFLLDTFLSLGNPSQELLRLI